jgi:hypothetical protein
LEDDQAAIHTDDRMVLSVITVAHIVKADCSSLGKADDFQAPLVDLGKIKEHQFVLMAGVSPGGHVL